jgi:radical SAM enzyme (TIGR01210 family)
MMEEYARILNNKTAVIEIGLESSDPWILRNCVNKSMSLEDYVRAIGIASSHGVRTNANVLLGHAFLTESEAIDDAVASIAWALDQGTDRCVLFPTHVKPWTLIQWLWENGMYEPPSLWSLVEVLRRLDPEQAKNVFISWYRPQYDEEHIRHGKRSSRFPTTCPDCRDSVLDLLDEYRRSRDYVVIENLISQNCSCKTEWQALIGSKPDGSLTERVARSYEIIGPRILTPENWQREHSKLSTS